MKIRNALLAAVSAVSLFGLQSKLNAMAGPGFEIMNKSTNPIWVEIITQSSAPETMEVQGNKGKVTKRINLDEQISVLIHLERPLIAHKTPHKSYTISAPGKTKYITWDPSKSTPLYPQTGRLMGLSGISDSGYSLKDNIKANDIRR